MWAKEVVAEGGLDSVGENMKNIRNMKNIIHQDSDLSW